MVPAWIPESANRASLGLVPRPYFFLLLSLFIHERHSEAEKKGMGVQLRKSKTGLGNRVIHKDFYERGRYVAHNRDVRYFPTHSELIRLYCTETTTKLCCKSDQRWPALVAVPAI